MYVYIYIYIYIYTPTGAYSAAPSSENGEVLLRWVGTLRYVFPPNASVQWQPNGLTICTKKRFLGARFPGVPPISLKKGISKMGDGSGHASKHRRVKRSLVFAKTTVAPRQHTRHILPPSEIDLGLFWADFTDLEGKHLFHRIG